MSLPIKITKPTRRVKCHVPGCRNRDGYKITRRNDVNGNPLFICEECMRDIGDFSAKLHAKTKDVAPKVDEKPETATEDDLIQAVKTRARKRIAENAESENE